MGIRDRTVSHHQGCSEPDSGVQHVESGDADCKRCGIGADAEPRSLEGLLDLGAAAVLVFEKNVKAFFGK